MRRQNAEWILRAVNLAALTALTALPALAQTRFGLSAGVVTMTPLVRDSIVEPFTVRANPGPNIGFWLETRLDSAYGLRVGLSTAWSHLVRHRATTNTEVIPLSTFTPVISLDRRLARDLRAYAMVGAIIYRADRTASNLFRNGSSPAPLFGVGVRADQSISSGLQLTLSLGYDIHWFSTPALRSAGFQGERPVHRVGLSVGVSRGL